MNNIEEAKKNAVNAKEAINLLKFYFNAGITPFLKGSPGVGKSAILQQIADKNNLELI